MFYQFMNDTNHVNATFVTTNVYEKTFWMHMLHLFMKERRNKDKETALIRAKKSFN